jgi:hypothetical protein
MSTRNKVRVGVIAVCLLLLLGGFFYEVLSEPDYPGNDGVGVENVENSGNAGSAENAGSNETATASDARFQELFDTRASDVQVTGTGAVVRLLADDNEGDRHQRFIVELSSGQTLLIVHNIDIAPRVEPLQVGDTVEFCGEYVYNDEGGLVHWTHGDPDGSHAAGYLMVGGKKFS